MLQPAAEGVACGNTSLYVGFTGELEEGQDGVSHPRLWDAALLGPVLLSFSTTQLVLQPGGWGHMLAPFPLCEPGLPH